MRIRVRRQPPTGRELPFPKKKVFTRKKERKAMAPSRFLPHVRAFKLVRKKKKKHVAENRLTAGPINIGVGMNGVAKMRKINMPACKNAFILFIKKS